MHIPTTIAVAFRLSCGQALITYLTSGLFKPKLGAHPLDFCNGLFLPLLPAKAVRKSYSALSLLCCLNAGHLREVPGIDLVLWQEYLPAMANRYGVTLHPDALRLAAAERVSENLIAAVLLLHHRSVEEVAAQLSASELERVIRAG